MVLKKNKWSRIWLTVGIILLLTGFFVWRKSWKLAHENSYYAYYRDVKGLQASSHVNLKGVNVGKISDIDIGGLGKVKVTIVLKKEIELPDGTVALITTSGLLGDKSIKLVPGSGPGMIANGGTIPTAFDTSVMPTSVQITPYLETLKAMLGFADSTLYLTDRYIRTGLMKSFAQTAIQIEKESKNYATLVEGINVQSTTVINSVNEIGASAEKMNADGAHLIGSIKKVEAKTAELNKSSIKENIQKIQQSVSNLNKSITRTASKDSGIGTLINKNDAYKNTATSLEKTNVEMQHLKDNPQGFSILGGKKKKK